MILTLVRDYHGADCSLGVLTVGTAALQTIELPWVPALGLLCGEPDRSCVPVGTYDLIPHNSEAHPHTFALSNPALAVYPASAPPGQEAMSRVECLLHIANWVKQLLGCIAVGTDRLQVNGVWQVVNSRVAMGRLQALVPWISGHLLEIS